MSNAKVCPHCGAELPRVADAHCPQCREELTVDEPAAVETSANADRAESKQLTDLPALAAAVQGPNNPTMEETAEPPDVRRGRVVVNSVLAVSFVADFVQLALAIVVYGNQWQPLRNPLFGFVALVVLGVFIYQGHSWARYVLALRCVVFALSTRVFIDVLFTDPRPVIERYFPVLLMFTLIAGISYAACAVALIALGDVGRFLKSRRKKPETQVERQVQATCEECGKISVFPGRQIGTTQRCRRCGAYVDVRG